ncbi:hypothetical protein [Nocardia jiangxiensis]|uniref:hypothetical protein n=1 Tax=Nocardia jiangxiensis TaxID=282685 RepID=UPI0003120C89|nr:hypothetical protein [Nocardia jiangxiensis]
MTGTSRTTFLVAGICALGVVASACVGGHPPARSVGQRCTAVFRVPFDRVDACSARSVMTAAVATVFSYRPAEHVTAQAAFDNAASLMSPDYAARAEPAAAVLAPITPRMWQRWADGGVIVTAGVQVTGDDHPPDTATSGARVLAVTQRPSDNSPPIELIVYARTQRADPVSGWRITQLEVKT